MNCPTCGQAMGKWGEIEYSQWYRNCVTVDKHCDEDAKFCEVPDIHARVAELEGRIERISVASKNVKCHKCGEWVKLAYNGFGCGYEFNPDGTPHECGEAGK